METIYNVIAALTGVWAGLSGAELAGVSFGAILMGLFLMGFLIRYLQRVLK